MSIMKVKIQTVYRQKSVWHDVGMWIVQSIFIYKILVSKVFIENIKNPGVISLELSAEWSSPLLLLSFICWHFRTTVWMHQLDTNKMHREKAWWEFHVNGMSYIEQILEVTFP